ncbi:MAG: OmpA family protein [Cytophagales bacterium]|nr:OmpA family protein [Cytophagales bacterium]
MYTHIYAQRDTAKVMSEYTPSEIKKILKLADNYFDNGDYNAALDEYEFLVSKFPDDPTIAYRLGTCIIHEKYDKSEALPYFRYASQKGNIEAVKMMAITYHELYRFDEAMDKYNEYISKSDTTSKQYKNSNIKKLIENTETAMNYIKNPVKGVVVENLGSNINSPYPDYVPVVNADDQEIFFTSRRPTSTGGRLDHNKEFFEDIFHAERDSTGKWKAAKHLSDNLNSHHHDAVAGLSADAHTLIMYKNDLQHGAGDLYVSYLRGNDWSEPVMIDGEVNLPESWEPSASLTANEDGLYFSSNRRGGYGGSDIYFAKRMYNGKWGKPENIGNSVNSEYDEDAPFIHPDGNTLYFSSNGHENMGGYDIFKSTKLPNGQWSAPQNMGYPINSADDDVFFVLSANNKHGYLSSIRQDSYGEKDIYQVTFPDEDRALAVVKGRVSDTKDNNVGAQIYLSKNGAQKLSGLFNSNISTGKYLFVLQPGNSYRVVFAATGYHNDTIYIDTKDIDSYNHLIKNIVLKPIINKENTINEKIVNNIDKPAYEKELIVLHKKGWVAPTPKLEVVVDTAGKIKYVENTTSAKALQKDTATMTTHKNVTNNVSLNDKNVFTKDCVINSGDSTHIYNFNFGYKMETLNAAQIATLNTIFDKYKKIILFIKINTHTDNKGSEKYNMMLSQKRGNYIVKYVLNKGIHRNKIYDCYFGKSRPIAPNEWPDGTDNPEGRHLNRRAEIQIILK